MKERARFPFAHLGPLYGVICKSNVCLVHQSRHFALASPLQSFNEKHTPHLDLRRIHDHRTATFPQQRQSRYTCILSSVGDRQRVVENCLLPSVLCLSDPFIMPPFHTLMIHLCRGVLLMALEEAAAGAAGDA